MAREWGADPRSSVLNPFNQSWDVPNLFVTDGACFVSSGHQSHTLTIMALTVSACGYIVATASGRGAVRMEFTFVSTASGSRLVIVMGTDWLGARGFVTSGGRRFIVALCRSAARSRKLRAARRRRRGGLYRLRYGARVPDSERTLGAWLRRTGA